MTRLLDATISAVLYIYHCLCRVCFAIFHPPPSKLDPTSHPTPNLTLSADIIKFRVSSSRRHIHFVLLLTAGVTARVYSVLDISKQETNIRSSIPNNASSDASTPSPKPKQVRHRRRRSTRWFPIILKNRATHTDIVALVRQAFEDCHDDEYEARAVFDRQSAWGTIKSLVIQNPDEDDDYDHDDHHSYDNVPTTPTSQCWTEALPPYSHSTPPPPAFAKFSSRPGKLRYTPSFINAPFPCTSSAPSTIAASLSSNLKISDTTQSLPALLSHAHALPCVPPSFSAPSICRFNTESASVESSMDARMSNMTEPHVELDVPEEIDADWSDVLSLDAYVD
ncbi:hypothetical protein BDZ89DRAFT_1137078 [Hymenopellis radicata]|nr:hypothetical protein BDZ89DRAFT_1137078 [Hymenopellis radicata]